jgi:AraC-like DNA-binding protein
MQSYPLSLFPTLKPGPSTNLIDIASMKRRDAQIIQEIKDYIDEHLHEEFSIKDLCQQFMINREKLQLGFHELVQATAHAYIIRQRIEQAAKRLLESDDSVKAIALDSGYKKQRSFNKSFKSIYKLTPASYRKLHQQCEEANS